LPAALEIGNYYDAVGHNDIVYRVERHFEANPESIPEHEVVVVDEYQDLNYLETHLIDSLAQASAVLIAGDDDQALYAFKGSSRASSGSSPTTRTSNVAERVGSVRNRPEDLVDQLELDLAEALATELRAGARPRGPFLDPGRAVSAGPRRLRELRDRPRPSPRPDLLADELLRPVQVILEGEIGGEVPGHQSKNLTTCSAIHTGFSWPSRSKVWTNVA
jgi:hypothetical protein